jgi:hypothetical protein
MYAVERGALTARPVHDGAGLKTINLGRGD